MADTAVHNVEGELTIPLKKGEDGEDHYAVGSVSLSMDSKNKDYKKYSETMADMDGIIKDIVLQLWAIILWMRQEPTPNQSSRRFLKRFRNDLILHLFMVYPIISYIIENW